jgi:hypothetical protein
MGGVEQVTGVACCDPQSNKARNPGMEFQFVEDPSFPPRLAENLRLILHDVHVAPPSEKLAAFTRAARRTAREIVGPAYPRHEAVDRLWATAEAHGLVGQFDANIIQSELAAAFSRFAPDVATAR